MNINSVKSTPSFGAKLDETYACEQLRRHVYDLGLSHEDWERFIDDIKAMPQKVVTFDEFIREDMFGRSVITGDIKDARETIPIFLKVHDTINIVDDIVSDLRLNISRAGKMVKKAIK